MPIHDSTSAQLDRETQSDEARKKGGEGEGRGREGCRMKDEHGLFVGRIGVH